eukprot:428417-Pyramimonas_sp.AAC.1
MACLGGSRPPPFYYEIWSSVPSFSSPTGTVADYCDDDSARACASYLRVPIYAHGDVRQACIIHEVSFNGRAPAD